MDGTYEDIDCYIDCYKNAKIFHYGQSILESYIPSLGRGRNIVKAIQQNLDKNIIFNITENKEYKIPNEELLLYQDIIRKIGRNRILEISHRTNDYLKSLITKKNTWDDIKMDMSLKGLSGKNYIHSIGKWDEYINYLEKMCV